MKTGTDYRIYVSPRSQIDGQPASPPEEISPAAFGSNLPAIRQLPRSETTLSISSSYFNGRRIYHCCNKDCCKRTLAVFLIVLGIAGIAVGGIMKGMDPDKASDCYSIKQISDSIQLPIIGAVVTFVGLIFCGLCLPRNPYCIRYCRNFFLL